jgi:hypothetical protein
VASGSEYLPSSNSVDVVGHRGIHVTDADLDVARPQYTRYCHVILPLARISDDYEARIALLSVFDNGK